MCGGKLKVASLMLAVDFLGANAASADIIERFALGVRSKGWELTGSKGLPWPKQEPYPHQPQPALFLFCPDGVPSLEWDRFTAVMEQDGKPIWDTFTLWLWA